MTGCGSGGEGRGGQSLLSVLSGYRLGRSIRFHLSAFQVLNDEPEFWSSWSFAESLKRLFGQGVEGKAEKLAAFLQVASFLPLVIFGVFVAQVFGDSFSKTN